MTTICRHIKTNGARCGSPSLADQPYCFFHRALSDLHPAPPAPEPPTIIHPLNPGRDPHAAAVPPTLSLPALEDRESIQLAVSMTLGALARNTLDTKRAAVLLYGLQVASANARNLDKAPSRLDIVTHTVLTPNGTVLAPDEDPARELAYQELLQSLEHDDEDDEESDDAEDAGHEEAPAAARAYLTKLLLGS